MHVGGGIVGRQAGRQVGRAYTWLVAGKQVEYMYTWLVGSMYQYEKTCTYYGRCLNR